MASGKIHLTEAELDQKISTISQKIATLNEKLSAYEQQKTTLDMMIGAGDTAAAAMRAIVEANIVATKTAISMAEAAKAMLEQTKTGMNAFVAGTTSQLGAAQANVTSQTSSAKASAILG